LLIFVSLVVVSRSKMEDVSSLRILGSNTEQNFFNETTDQENVFLKKNEFHILNNNFVSNLNLSKYTADSLDIERIAGSSDSLLLLSKTGLKLFLKETNKTTSLKNFAFTTCDQMALVDSFVVVSQGKTACQPNMATKFSLFKINKFTELVYISQYLSPQVLDLKVMKRKVFILDSEGFLSVYEVKNGTELVKLSEVVITKPQFMRVIPGLNKVLVKANGKVSQFKLSVGNKLEKINEI